MAKFLVTYDHECTITYEAVVEADSVEEAERKMNDFDFLSEEQTNMQGESIEIKEVEEIVEDEVKI